ncbi:MAG: hypothetical protein LBI42_04785 [Chitinispirillales bacterium]|jgi:hypothetical protein|nr:hypothetical protein [Chitinispirillales bacterium]
MRKNPLVDKYQNCLILLIITLASFGHAMQQFEDTLLFTIKLTDDSTSLYHCVWDDRIRETLAGPVLMAENTFLFHSKNGYALYNADGKLLDEHSLVKDNIKAAAGKQPQVYFAYPFDSTTLIYYTEGDGPLEVFRKKLFKKGLVKVAPAEMEMFNEIRKFHPLNIYRSGATEDIGSKTYISKHLAGFTALEGGAKWWTTDLFFSFTSPLIMEQDGKFASFFPGLKEGGRHCDAPIKLIEPLGVFSREGRWYYLGIYSVTGSKDNEYFQTVALCDQAGNVLYCNQLLKQEMTDAVLQERRDTVTWKLTHFTVRKAGRHVFVPAVNAFGDIYYGMVNWEWKKIDVYKRRFIRFLPKSGPPAFADKFAKEEQFSFIPVKIECSNASRRGVLPEVLAQTENGMLLLAQEDLAKDNYYVKIHRLPNEELQKKLSRIHHTMPKHIAAMQDSISKLPTTWCPYGISLNHTAIETLSNLDYGFGDIVVCARVLGVSESKSVYVRVDLENWAEVVVFTQEGHFIERFTFNNQHFNDRKDAVTLSPNDEIYEKDYEGGIGRKGAAGHRFVAWKKDMRPVKEPAASSKPARKKR